MARRQGPQRWWHGAVGYQIYIRSFADSTGDGIGAPCGSGACAGGVTVCNAGTDGIICPHATVFARVDGPSGDPGEARLAIGIAMSEDLAPEDIGRPVMVEKVALGE